MYQCDLSDSSDFFIATCQSAAHVGFAPCLGLSFQEGHLASPELS